ncbi:uncharacterized protein [Henckelia pumila]|uniref:uncharacterized protein n=1 Tax=Henckelia pumila TaxID=405737 RepID=UPI003C6DF28F
MGYEGLLMVPVINRGGGHEFTWEKNRGTPNFVEERFDRAMATSAWMSSFTIAEVLNLEVIANRLKTVLKTIFSPMQSAFQTGKSISDNVLIAFEIRHYLKRKTHEKRGEEAFKIDMSKVYDRIEWASVDECGIIKEFLRKYEIASGQTVNFTKSSISFSSNVLAKTKNGICDLLGVPYTTNHELERMMNSFWWGKGDNNRGCLRWKSWAKLRRIKSEGGLSFRRMHEYNIALLAKQGWKLMTDQNSVASKVLKARYFLHCSFIEACCNTKIWGEPWLPDLNNPYIESDCIQYLQLATVNLLRLEGIDSWDIDLLKELFNAREQQLILSIPLSRRFCEDKWMWVLIERVFTW